MKVDRVGARLQNQLPWEQVAPNLGGYLRLPESTQSWQLPHHLQTASLRPGWCLTPLQRWGSVPGLWDLLQPALVPPPGLKVIFYISLPLALPEHREENVLL